MATNFLPEPAGNRNVRVINSANKHSFVLPLRYWFAATASRELYYKATEVDEVILPDLQNARNNSLNRDFKYRISRLIDFLIDCKDIHLSVED